MIMHKLYKNEQLDLLIKDVIDIKTVSGRSDILLYITGGGAYKFKTEIEVSHP